MNRSYWMKVFNNNNSLVFKNDLCRKLSVNNSGKNRGHLITCSFLSTKSKAFNASSRVSQTEINLPLWQKIAPGMPDAFFKSSSINPAHSIGKGKRTFILSSIEGGMPRSFQCFPEGIITNFAK